MPQVREVGAHDLISVRKNDLAQGQREEHVQEQDLVGPNDALLLSLHTQHTIRARSSSCQLRILLIADFDLQAQSWAAHKIFGECQTSSRPLAELHNCTQQANWICKGVPRQGGLCVVEGCNSKQQTGLHGYESPIELCRASGHCKCITDAPALADTVAVCAA